MPKFLVALIGLVATAIGLAKAILEDTTSESGDEFDLAVVAGRQRLRLRGQPLIEGRILVILASAELDLRRAVPGPTGIEIHPIVILGRLRVVANSLWQESDLRVKSQCFFGSVQLERRPSLTAVAS